MIEQKTRRIARLREILKEQFESIDKALDAHGDDGPREVRMEAVQEVILGLHGAFRSVFRAVDKEYWPNDLVAVVLAIHPQRVEEGLALSSELIGRSSSDPLIGTAIAQSLSQYLHERAQVTMKELQRDRSRAEMGKSLADMLMKEMRRPSVPEEEGCAEETPCCQCGECAQPTEPKEGAAE